MHLGDHRAGKERPKREAAKRDDEARLDERQLPLQVRPTGSDLARQRIAVVRRPVFDHVRDVHIAPLELGDCQQLLEELAGRPDEGAALLVLVESGSLANQHDAGIGGPFTGHAMRGASIEIAAGAVLHLAAKSLELRTGAGAAHRLLVGSVPVAVAPALAADVTAAPFRTTLAPEPTLAAVPATPAFATALAATIVRTPVTALTPEAATTTGVAAAIRALLASALAFLGVATVGLEQRAVRQIDAAHRVDTGNFHLEPVADVHDVFHTIDAVRRQLGDVDQSLLARQHLDECAEVHDAAYRTVVLLADLHLRGETLDHVDCLLSGLVARACDVHRAVVLDVDRCLALGNDLLDLLAPRADDRADLFRVDLDAGDARRKRRQVGARLRDHSFHLVQNEEASGARLLQRLGHDCPREAMDLDVHLDRGHALARPGDFEVHVAHGIFDALNVGQDRVVALVIADQSHGDARDRGFDRDPGIHQCQRAAGGRCHGGRPVRGENLRDNSNRVREVFLPRNNRGKGALGQHAVSNIPPARAAQRPRLTGAERREVVVVHVPLGLVLTEAVDDLLVRCRAEGSNRQRLCLTTAEQAAAVNARQHADVDADRPDLGALAPVRPDVLLQDHLARGLLEQAFECRPDISRLEALLFEVRLNLGLQGVDRGLALLLGRVHQIVVQPRADKFGKSSRQIVGECLEREDPLFFAARLSHPFLQVDERDDRLMTGVQGLEDHVLRHLVGPGLYHHDRVPRRRHYQIELTVLELRNCGIDNHLSVDVAHSHRSDRSVERDIGDGERRRRAVDGKNVGIVLLIEGERGEHDLNVVPEPLREQRAHGTVGKPGHQYGLGARPAFALDVATWNLPGGVQLFLVVNGKWKEVDIRAGLFGRDRRRKYHRLPVGDGDGAARL